jgi:hypothetical protein
MASKTPEDGFGFGLKGSYFPGHERKMEFGFKGTPGQDFPNHKRQNRKQSVLAGRNLIDRFC